MKAVLSGNEALARGAYEAGVKLVSSYPGTPSTEITEQAAKYKEMYVEWATNEKVALEVMLGSSMAGARSLTAMKHVGLNVAADPLMTSSYTGANGGAVIIVADDPNMHSSQNEQDSRHFARMAKLPMLEPADSQECLDYIKNAFNLSEKYQCPVLLRSTTRVSHSLSVVNASEREEHENIPYQKDISRWVMTPGNARKRHVIVEERLIKLAEEADSYATEHNMGNDIGIITSGSVYQYVREALPKVSVLKLGMVWPLPINKINEFASKVKKLYLLEELDTVIETELKAAGIKLEKLNRNVCGELSVEAVEKLFGEKHKSKPIQALGLSTPLPLRPPNMCAGCSHRGIFYAISRLRLNVSGDIGCYTLGSMEPLGAMDSCVCMGGSISMAHGFDKGVSGLHTKKSVSVIGDSTFLHTGINSLINTVYNQGSSTIIILDNRITGMTGHQPNPASGFSITGDPAPKIDFIELCRALGVKNISVVDPFDVDACVKVLREETQKDDVSVIITNRPCIFADKTVITEPYKVDSDHCSGCKACIRLGCPAISWDEAHRQAIIDEAQCTGCGLCPNVCRFNAIAR